MIILDIKRKTNINYIMNKNFLFFTGHPAQVHNFKNVYWELEKKGYLRKQDN